MRINMRTALIGGTLLAASAFGLYQCNKNKNAEIAAQQEQMKTEAFQTADEYSFYVTTGVTVDDIKKSNHIGDTLRQRNIQIFDTNNNGIIERSEANVFNSTRIIENPANNDELILHTAMKDGTTKETIILRKDSNSYKYKMDESLVANWRNLPVVKLLKNLNNIVNPKIPTIANIYCREDKSGKYSFADTETFEGSGNDKVYKYTEYNADAVLRNSTEYRNSDGTTINTTVYNDYKKEKKFYRNDSCYRSELYANNRLDIYENGTDSVYVDGQLIKTIKEIDKNNYTISEYYPNGKIKSEITGFMDKNGNINEYYSDRKYYDEQGHLIKEVSGNPEEQYATKGNLTEYYTNGKVKHKITFEKSKMGSNYRTKVDIKYDENGKQISCKKEDIQFGE